MRGYTRDSGLLVADAVEAQKRSYAHAATKALSRDQKGIKARPGLIQRRKINRILHLPDGSRMNLRMDESGVASEHEHDDHQDAFVFPAAINFKWDRDRFGEITDWSRYI